MSSKTRYYFFLIVTGLSIGFFLAINDRWQGEEESLDTVKMEEVVVEDLLPEKEKPVGPEKPINKPAPKPTKKISPTLSCETADFDLEKTVNEIADKLESQKILYNSKSLSDCSGIFLRVGQEMNEICPMVAVPTPKEARDGRRLAKWYYDRDRLTLIQDAKASSEWIKPGAIMFYGHRNKHYEAISIQDITASSGIEHIGIVTAVERDKKGIITNYTLFHGRSTGKMASKTTHHHLNPSRKGIPAYGNWNQQWVAVADLF